MSRIKEIVALGVVYSGLGSLINSLRRISQNKRVIILCYHRVVDGRLGGFALKVGITFSKEFEKQIKYLIQKYNIISLEALNNYIQNGEKLPKNPVIITFDDGYKDVYANAYPILKKYKVPVTVFITTDYIGSKRLFWWDKVVSLLNNTNFKKVNLPGLRRLNLKDPLQKRKAFLRITERLKEMGEEERKEFIEALERKLEVTESKDQGKDLFLSWEEVKAMSNDGIDFGTHTASHPFLRRVPLSVIKEEIVSSKQKIEEETGKKIDFFAYSFGHKGSFNQATEQILKENEISLALTTFFGVNTLEEIRKYPYRLKRIVVGRGSFTLFKAKISGVFDLLKFLKR